MVITLGNLIIWLIIAALVGFVGELLARRRTPFGIVGAMIVGFIAILLVVGVLHWHIDGEPYLNGVPRSRLSWQRRCSLPYGARLRIAMLMATIPVTTIGVAAMCADHAGTGGDPMPVSDRCGIIPSPEYVQDMVLAHALRPEARRRG